MAKKIVILNGSPRKNGNTASLTAAFKRGAEEAGNEVTEFFLAHMKINGCLGCWHGGKDAAIPAYSGTIWKKFIRCTKKRMSLCLLPRFITGSFPAF